MRKFFLFFGGIFFSLMVALSGVSYAKPAPIHVLTLSGWGQSLDVLDGIVPQPAVITHFDYHAYKDREAVLKALGKIPEQPDVVIGWSLGGRLAARAVAMGVLKPKLLVLLSTSFQFIPGGGINNAVQKGEKNAFYDAFLKNPDQTRKTFLEAMVKGDTNAVAIREKLRMDTQHNADWLHWLQTMRFGAEDLNFSTMPRTLIIHGANDTLVLPNQASFFKEAIRNSRLEIIAHSGHIPYLHAPKTISKIIAEELQAQKH